MLTKDFINNTLPLADADTSVKKALKLTKEYRIEQIPACINGICGFFANTSLDIVPKETPLSKVVQMMQKISLNTEDHIWESIRTFSHYDTEVLPVLDEDKQFAGVVLLKDIFKRMFEVFPIGNGGAILELEQSYSSYTLNELAGIVEGSNAKITLLSVFPIEGTSKVRVVFCIDKNDATEVIQALERHSYHVNAWFMNKGKIDNILEERYEAFMNYINL